MNHELLEYDIYHWLLSLSILSPTNPTKFLPSQKYELDDTNSRQLVNGLKFGEILKLLIGLMGKG
jgi:hypothetical protein